MRPTALSLILLFTLVSFDASSGADQASKPDNSLKIMRNLSEILRKTDPTVILRKVLEYLRPSERMEFFLYTAKNPKTPQKLRLYDVDSILESNFNASNPTRIIIHGWMSDSGTNVNTMIRDAYLSKGPHNIIAVNWVSESVQIYDLSIKHVPRIGLRLAKFIDFLAENDCVHPQNITIIGHSLGSHIAGIAARSLNSGRIHTIIGLDPAAPGFSYNTSKHRLRSTDAYYVESIHTTVGTLGYAEPIGRAAFYPNGGVLQPNCGLDLIKSCGHFRSYEYFAEAIRNGGFPCIRCDSYADALNMNCGNKFSETVEMGNPKNAEIASGIFFVPILPHPPYSYSKDG